jgi:phytoene dehydrogenase-like protein
VLAQAGKRVVVYEAEPTIGGGARSAEITLPGFTHDLCSAVHPFAAASPFFRSLPRAAHGLDWITPPAMLAHPFDDGDAVLVEASIEATAARLGRDRRAYTRVMTAFARNWPKLQPAIMGPLRMPRHPMTLARFGYRALQPADRVGRALFREPRTRALFAGLAAHGMLPLDRRPSAGFALTLGGLAHVVGWVLPRGGSQRITDALAAYLRSLGGEVVTGVRVRSIDELPKARAVLCDLSPKPFLAIAGARLPAGYRRRLEAYRYGMAAFKLDWALDGPIPWRAEACARAGTVHLGASMDEIARGERAAWTGAIADRPFVLISQPTLFDPTRAPAGRHIAWGYCHVPRGSSVDMVDRIEAQIERCAPGFRQRVLARTVTTPADIERRNANMVGGDIGAGVSDLRQIFTRPTWREYSTPVKGLYLCSAATPPGVGVHGMCGYFAARRALAELWQD